MSSQSRRACHARQSARARSDEEMIQSRIRLKCKHDPRFLIAELKFRRRTQPHPWERTSTVKSEKVSCTSITTHPIMLAKERPRTATTMATRTTMMSVFCAHIPMFIHCFSATSDLVIVDTASCDRRNAITAAKDDIIVHTASRYEEV